MPCRFAPKRSRQPLWPQTCASPGASFDDAQASRARPSSRSRIGIGATTAIFSVVYGILLKPLPYRDPANLVQLWEVNPLFN